MSVVSLMTMGVHGLKAVILRPLRVLQHSDLMTSARKGFFVTHRASPKIVAVGVNYELLVRASKAKEACGRISACTSYTIASRLSYRLWDDSLPKENSACISATPELHSWRRIRQVRRCRQSRGDRQRPTISRLRFHQPRACSPAPSREQACRRTPCETS
jgi:hypothetical protein